MDMPRVPVVVGEPRGRRTTGDDRVDHRRRAGVGIRGEHWCEQRAQVADLGQVLLVQRVDGAELAFVDELLQILERLQRVDLAVRSGDGVDEPDPRAARLLGVMRESHNHVSNATGSPSWSKSSPAGLERRCMMRYGFTRKTPQVNTSHTTPGDWRSGSALRSHRRGHWFEPSIAHPKNTHTQSGNPESSGSPLFSFQPFGAGVVLTGALRSPWVAA